MGHARSRLEAVRAGNNRSNINARLNPASEGKRVEKISADEIEEWRDERGLSRRTVNKLLINLGAILERAVKHRGLLRNPAKDVPKLRVRYDPDAYDFSAPMRSPLSAPPPAQTRTVPST